MKVLVVDDEQHIRESIRKILELEGFTVETAENGLAAERKISGCRYDVVVSDQKMPGMTGIELLDSVQSMDRNTSFIIMSAYGDISDAVKAMKHGARDYIAKPFNPDDLLAKLGHLQGESLPEMPESGLIGEGPTMLAVKERIRRIADTRSTVLITGESGTGKEVTARYIHSGSPVADGPFVGVNIGGIPENLLESELFGYEKGAFTGAEKMKTGLFETASGGTLFLDEIGEMPHPVQVKLLRVLQERTIRRLGSSVEIPLDVRIITATNRRLEDEVQKARFREDLFYRLNIARIHLPPLRERREDIPQFVQYFLEKLNIRMNRNVTGLTGEAADRLSTWHFPGNIRELENILERAIIYADSDRLTSTNLDLPESPGPTFRLPEPGSLKELEKNAIETALIRWEGNRTRAAEELGISRRTILNKIGEFGLSGEKPTLETRRS